MFGGSLLVFVMELSPGILAVGGVAAAASTKASFSAGAWGGMYP